MTARLSACHRHAAWRGGDAWLSTAVTRVRPLGCVCGTGGRNGGASPGTWGWTRAGAGFLAQAGADPDHGRGTCFCVHLGQGPSSGQYCPSGSGGDTGRRGPGPPPGAPQTWPGEGSARLLSSLPTLGEGTPPAGVCCGSGQGRRPLCVLGGQQQPPASAAMDTRGRAHRQERHRGSGSPRGCRDSSPRTRH